MSALTNSAAAQNRQQRRKRKRTSLYESARMFNENYDKVFCAHRPHLAYQPSPLSGPTKK